MSNIPPLGSFQQIQSSPQSRPVIQNGSQSPRGFPLLSQISSEKKSGSGSILSYILIPFRLIGRLYLWVKSWITSFFPSEQQFIGKKGKVQSNAVKARVFFDEMYDTVISSDTLKCPKEQQSIQEKFEKFAKEFRKCDQAAYLRFKQHIAYAIAQSYNCNDRQKQDEYVAKHFKTIKFEEYFGNIKSQALVNALKTYKQELDEMLD